MAVARAVQSTHSVRQLLNDKTLDLCGIWLHRKLEILQKDVGKLVWRDELLVQIPQKHVLDAMCLGMEFDADRDKHLRAVSLLLELPLGEIGMGRALGRAHNETMARHGPAQLLPRREKLRLSLRIDRASRPCLSASPLRPVLHAVLLVVRPCIIVFVVIIIQVVLVWLLGIVLIVLIVLVFRIVNMARRSRSKQRFWITRTPLNRLHQRRRARTHPTCIRRVLRLTGCNPRLQSHRR